MNAQRVVGFIQQFSTAMTTELTADSGSSIALIAAKVDSGVFSLSTNFPGCRISLARTNIAL